MKDIDERLRRSAPYPRRPLSADFTIKAITLVKDTSGKSKRRPKWKEYIIVKLLHKPAIAALAVVATIALGGTAYAAVNGGLSSITALFGGEKQHDATSRIVKVDLQNCHDRNPFNIVSGTGKGNTPRYYRIKNSADISNDQMVAIAQSICRASYNPDSEQALAGKIDNAPENKDKLVGNAIGTIVALTPNSIDIRISKASIDHKPFIEHFTHIDPKLVVFDGSGVAKGIEALHVGDTIYSSYRASGPALAESESLPLNYVDWSQQTLVTVYKQTPDEAMYERYQTLEQQGDITQVVPCQKTSSGYCTYEESHQ